MHFSKLISSFLAVSVLAVPGLCESKREIESTDLSAGDIGLAGRAPVIDVVDLDTRKLTAAKAPAKAPVAAPAAGKASPAPKKATPAVNSKSVSKTASASTQSTSAAAGGSCSLPQTLGTASKARRRTIEERRLAKRVQTIEVDLGETKTGQRGDTVFTQGLDTCSGLVATGPTTADRKVVTHLSPAQTANNYAAFRTAALALGPANTLRVYASCPANTQGGAAGTQALTDCCNFINQSLQRDFPGAVIRPRPAPANGQAVSAKITVDGSNNVVETHCVGASLA